MDVLDLRFLIIIPCFVSFHIFLFPEPFDISTCICQLHFYFSTNSFEYFFLMCHFDLCFLFLGTFFILLIVFSTQRHLFTPRIHPNVFPKSVPPDKFLTINSIGCIRETDVLNGASCVHSCIYTYLFSHITVL